MKFANVVPIRRMPADRPWLTYAVPKDIEVSIGSLVTIPLRGRPILGVVWNFDEPTKTLKAQNITSAHLGSPLMSAWQRKVCDVMADTGSTSLGDVLWRVIPKLTVRNITKIITGQLQDESSPNQSTSSVLWYRQRTEALKS